MKSETVESLWIGTNRTFSKIEITELIQNIAEREMVGSYPCSMIREVYNEEGVLLYLAIRYEGTVYMSASYWDQYFDYTEYRFFTEGEYRNPEKDIIWGSARTTILRYYDYFDPEKSMESRMGNVAIFDKETNKWCFNIGNILGKAIITSKK